MEGFRPKRRGSRVAGDDLRQHLVHRAGAITLEVERHVCKPELFQAGDDSGAELVAEEARKLCRANLDPGGPLIVMAHPEFAKARVAEERLRLVDPAETLLRDAGFREFRVRHHDERRSVSAWSIRPSASGVIA